MMVRLCVAVLVAGALLGCKANDQSVVRSGQEDSVATARQEPFVRRPLDLVRGGQWLGEGMAYGPHRDGQRPGGAGPSQTEIAEDLRILAHSCVLDLNADASHDFVLEPPTCELHYWREGTGLISHISFIGDYGGRFPYYDERGKLID